MRTFRFLLASLFLAAAPLVRAQLAIDASTPLAAPHPLAFETGGRSPNGHVLGVNDRYFTRDDQPWFPIMGEFHFARYPAAEWDAELAKMKAGGIEIVATYVFWIFHEEQEGRFEWTGQRDLRHFIELCAKHGLYVWLRVGPWDHGEARNGGFPDWLVAAGPVRENAPGYLEHVQKFFGQIGQQVRRQFWKDGGPIVGVQLENEYHPAKDGEAHMTKLLELAHGAGLDAPFYTATGWDKAVIPPTGFLPVFGGYTEQFWSDSRTELPPNQNFFFTTIRAEDNVGYTLQPKDRAYHQRHLDTPFLTAEMGGGMAVAYHRRPVMYAADSTAAAFVKLGSGITLLGYYMYHGGTNPDGHGPMHEAFSGWNAFNELETKSYDFQAPLGESGQMRDTYRTTKALHLFLHDFGAQLAPMAAYFPQQTPRSLDDSITPRVALRSNGTTGFLFINNYQRDHPLPAHCDFQVTVKQSGGATVAIPSQPTTLPSGVYTCWPIDLSLGGAMIRSATAQLLCHLGNPDTYVFSATPGVPAEFVLTGSAGGIVSSTRGRTTQIDGAIQITELEPGRDAPIAIRRADGTVAKIVLLSHEDGLNLWKAPLAGAERLMISSASLRFADDRVEAEANSADDLQIAVFPALAKSGGQFKEQSTTGLFTEYAANGPAAATFAAVKQVRPAAPAPAVKLNADPKRAVAVQPTDADFAGAATWSIALPESTGAENDRALLRVHYRGDVARLYAGDRLLTDNFYKGTPFEFGLWRLTADERKAGLTLKVLPLRRDAPIYFPREAKPKFDAKGEALELEKIEIVPLRTATLEAKS